MDGEDVYGRVDTSGDDDTLRSVGEAGASGQVYEFLARKRLVDVGLT